MESQPANAQYPYFTRSFKIELALFMLFGPVLTSLWAVTGYYYYYSGRLSIPLVKSAIYFTATLIFSLIFYGNARAVSASKSVVVEKDRVVKKSPRGTAFVHLADIIGVRPFIKRWVVLQTSGGGRFTLPLRVHGGREMVEKIFGGLRERGTLIDDSELIEDKLCGAARLFNTLHDLRIDNISYLLRAMTLSAAFHSVVAIVFWESGLMFTMVWGITNMFMQAAAYFIAERIHLKKLMRGDGGAEGQYLLAGILALFAGMATAILITEAV